MVLAIVAVVTALTLPQLQNVNQNNAARNDAYRFVQMMRDASQLARSTREIICVFGDPSSGQFEFVEPSTTSYVHCDPVRGNNGSAIYNETITWAFTSLIHERLQDGRGGRDVGEFLALNPDLADGLSVIHARYDFDTLHSELARRCFLLPRPPA